MSSMYDWPACLPACLPDSSILVHPVWLPSLGVFLYSCMHSMAYAYYLWLKSIPAIQFDHSRKTLPINGFVKWFSIQPSHARSIGRSVGRNLDGSFSSLLFASSLFFLLGTRETDGRMTEPDQLLVLLKSTIIVNLSSFCTALRYVSFNGGASSSSC